MYPIYVLDLETTGLNGWDKNEVIVEIGVVKINQDLTIENVYHEYVDPRTYTKKQTGWEKSWIFINQYLDPEIVKSKGITFDQLRKDCTELLGNKNVTSYNTKFDLTKYLCNEPYNIVVNQQPCIMEMTKVLTDSPRYLKLVHAYTLLCNPKSPIKWHTALADAQAAAEILIQLIHLLG